MVLGSSAVEQPAVNRLVAGSNPARGAILFRALALFAPLAAGLLGDCWTARSGAYRMIRLDGAA